MFLDLATIVVSFFVAYLCRSYNILSPFPISPISHYLFLLYVIIPVWAILLHYYKTYSSMRTMGPLQVLLPLLKTVIAGGIILIGVLYVFKIQTISRVFIGLFLIINFVSFVTQRFLLRAFLHYIRKRGHNYRTVLIVGTGKRATSLAKLIESQKRWGLRVTGFIDKDSSLVGKELDNGKVLGTLDQMENILISHQVDEVIFVVPRKWLDEIEKAILLCEEMGKKASIAADFYPHQIAGMEMGDISDWPLLRFNPTSKLDEVSSLKRTADIVLSSIFLVVSGPLLFLIALAIKFTSPGPVFFKQKRCGLNGRVFDMFKFRTMVDNAEARRKEVEDLNEMSGPVFKIHNDPRITPIGRVLRKYSLDELPQFINTLKGDMGIVGPRPPIPSETDEYYVWHRRRLSVRPGITCLWQIGGRNKLDFDEWVRLDLEYIDNWSWALDFKIMVKTIPTILMGTGL